MIYSAVERRLPMRDGKEHDIDIIDDCHERAARYCL